MKVQLEVFLTSVHLRLLTPSLSVTHSVKSSSSSASNTISQAKEELALESLLEFCREPSLMEDLYTNYDCDVQCTNLFDSIIHVLCIRAVPPLLIPPGMSQYRNKTSPSPFRDPGSAFQKSCDIEAYSNSPSMRISILNKIALDGVFAVLLSIATKCEKNNKSSRNSTRNGTNLLKQNGESPSHARTIAEGVSTAPSLAPSPVRAYPSGELEPDSTEAALLVDQWCLSEESDVGESGRESGRVGESRQAGNVALNALSSVESLSRDGFADENDKKSRDLSLSLDADEGMLAAEGDALTTAALTAHTEHSSPKQNTLNMQSPSKMQVLTYNLNGNGSGLTPIGSAQSTPRAMQLASQQALRASNSSPFSSTTSLEGKAEVLGVGDDDADFFHLARVKTAEVLRQRKLKKQRLRLASEKFNEMPLKPDWVHFALSLGLIRPSVLLEKREGIESILVDDRTLESSEKSPKNSDRNSPKSTTSNAVREVTDRLKEKEREYTLKEKEKEKEKDKYVKEVKKARKPDMMAIADADSVAKFLRYTPGTISYCHCYSVFNFHI